MAKCNVTLPEHASGSKVEKDPFGRHDTTSIPVEVSPESHRKLQVVGLIRKCVLQYFGDQVPFSGAGMS